MVHDVIAYQEPYNVMLLFVKKEPEDHHDGQNIINNAISPEQNAYRTVHIMQKPTRYILNIVSLWTYKKHVCSC